MHIIKKVVIGLIILTLSFSLFVFINGYYEPMFLVHLNTEYAKGFSYEKLERIKQGMSKQQVRQILGEPLYIWKPGYECFGYSRHVQTPWKGRWISARVCFGENEKVVVTTRNIF